MIIFLLDKLCVTQHIHKRITIMEFEMLCCVVATTSTELFWLQLLERFCPANEAMECKGQYTVAAIVIIHSL